MIPARTPKPACPKEKKPLHVDWGSVFCLYPALRQTVVELESAEHCAELHSSPESACVGLKAKGVGITKGLQEQRT